MVYKYTCPRCNLGTYLGSTRRMLKVRIDCHRGVSHRTGNNLNKKEFSNIREHAEKCKSAIRYDNFEIIAQTSDCSSLLVLESLAIKQLVPSLNSSSSSAPLYIAWEVSSSLVSVLRSLGFEALRRLVSFLYLAFLILSALSELHFFFLVFASFT